jgi:hypothetical protein
MRIALALFGIALVTVTLSAADFTGTWVLDSAKSTSTPVVSETMKIEQTGPNSYKTIIDAVLKSGEKRHQEIDRIYDGKEHPSTGVGIPGGASEICVMVNASTRKITQKRNGKLVSEFTTTVSPDGKTMNNRRMTGNMEEIQVFERQQ